ncbi:MAG: hypothetical protein Q9167_003594 [Letrouitia subvulpina]
MANSDEEHKSGSSTPAPKTSSTAGGPIALQVGETRFLASYDTLSGSGYLSSISSGRWEDSKQADGSYFIDVDPDAFKHVLRYLRHGVYPLCYDNVKGHDYAMYENIRTAAEYLVVEKLEDWLTERKYLDAVTKEHSLEVEEGLASHTIGSNVKVKYHHTYRTKKCYVCPRGIICHYDNRWKCGRECMKVRGNASDQYEDVQTPSYLVLKETVFVNSTMLRD